MVPAAVTIAFLLLGVEEIGVQIEEPFGILPLGMLQSHVHEAAQDSAHHPAAVAVRCDAICNTSIAYII